MHFEVAHLHERQLTDDSLNVLNNVKVAFIVPYICVENIQIYIPGQPLWKNIK